MPKRTPRPIVQRLVAASLALASLTGCGAHTSRSDTSAPAPAEPARLATPSPQPVHQARLVVVVVMDQLASWVLDTHLDALPEDGALRTGIREGAFHARAAFPYAATLTAPGHAAIHTGAPPARSGIAANAVWDRAAQAQVATVWDPEHPVIGVAGAGVSPQRLALPTVADVLKEHTGGHARVVSLSMKDRGAALAAGRRADLVLWYEPGLPGYTTSDFYAPERPAWLAAWQDAHPLPALLAPWQPLDPAGYRQRLGADARPGEGGAYGFDASFPHDPGSSPHPYAAVLATPQSSEHLLALASEAVERLELGADGIPDLLALSISGTDYVGHAFGPHSWEYLDNLIRVDRALATFLQRLQARTPTAVLITSDHGAAALPEHRAAQGEAGGRQHPGELHAALDAAADEALGPGDWVAAVIEPFVYLTDEARTDPRRDALIAALQAQLERRAGIEASFDVRQAAQLRASSDPLAQAVGRSIPDACAADLYLVHEQGWFMSAAEGGTSHGTPWRYDVEVPVIFWGTGAKRATSSAPVDQARVAATIAALLGVPAPAGTSDDRPLAGAPARR